MAESGEVVRGKFYGIYAERLCLLREIRLGLSKSCYMRLLFFVSFAFSVLIASAQKPFADEIAGFRQEDSVSFPGKGRILFVGSSSFRLWKDLQNDFPHLEIINRGFGGSTLDDVLLYKNEIIKPYAPRQVVIYCGENDLANGTSPEKVTANFVELFGFIRGNFPKADIIFVSIKPSPSRKHILDNVRKANDAIRQFMAKQKRATFVDVFSPMLDSKGDFREELFIEDRLHMNRKGYDIWKQALKPYLK